MACTMTRTKFSGMNADAEDIKILEDGKEVFSTRLYYGYDISWCRDFVSEDKPLINDKLLELASKYNIPIESIPLDKE